MKAEAMQTVMDSPLGREFVADILFNYLAFLAPNLHGEAPHDVVANATRTSVGNAIYNEILYEQPQLAALMIDERRQRIISEINEREQA